MQSVDATKRDSGRGRSKQGCSALEHDKIVAIGLLTETHVRMLGSSLQKVIPITDDGMFDDLLEALDKADSANTSL